MARVAALVLFMERQWRATRVTLEMLRQAREYAAGVGIEVDVVALLNGADTGPASEAIAREMRERFGFARLLLRDRNLGVAGGRNVLLRTPEAAGAEINAFLDNDILLPYDLFEAMVAFLSGLPTAGVVGPMVFGCSPLFSVMYDGSADLPRFSCGDVKRWWLETGAPHPIHLGAVPDPRRAYLSSASRVFSFAAEALTGKLVAHAFNTRDPAVLDAIRAGADRIEAGNIAGNAAFFRRSLVDEIGPLDERFNPYGGEDVDFCIRAAGRGYTHWINTAAAILHGTDPRQQQKESYNSRAQHVRAHVLLRRKHLGGAERYGALAGMMAVEAAVALGRMVRHQSTAPLVEVAEAAFDAWAAPLDDAPAG